MTLALALALGFTLGILMGPVLHRWWQRRDGSAAAADRSFEELKLDLKNTREQIRELEKERMSQYGRIEKQIETIAAQEQRLIEETGRLKSALTTSQSVRGRWGELVLRNILEQSDLVAGIDFEEQHTTSDGDGSTLRPDFVIRLPRSGQHLVIDSKASLFESYLESETEADESTRRNLHQGFVKRLRSRVQELASKEYQRHVSDSLPYVILFIPSEAAIRAAFDSDPALFGWAMEKRIFLASPATILPLLILVGQGWREHRVSERAQELSRVVEQLGDRIETLMKRLSKVQSGLDQAVRAWNDAVDKSWNGTQSVPRALDHARTIGASIQRGTELQAIESAVRPPIDASVSREEPGELPLGNTVPPVHDDGY